MDIVELHAVTARALGKDPAAVPENPEWDSLDKLEIITSLHDDFGDRFAQVTDLDGFTDLAGLAAVLRRSGLLD